jgi:hypothetical protein
MRFSLNKFESNDLGEFQKIKLLCGCTILYHALGWICIKKLTNYVEAQGFGSTHLSQRPSIK